MREIRELLEKAETKLLCTDDRLRPLGDIQQALTLLKQQPPVSDFTKKVRLDLENWTSALGINADVRVATVVGWLKEALEIIDQLQAEQPPASEFTKIQRKAAQLAADAYEEDQEWCPTKVSRLLKACDIIDQLQAEQLLGGEFTKEMRLTYELRPKIIDSKIAAKHIFELCDIIDRAEASKVELVKALTYIQKKSINLFHAKDVAKVAIAKATGRE